MRRVTWGTERLFTTSSSFLSASLENMVVSWFGREKFLELLESVGVCRDKELSRFLESLAIYQAIYFIKFIHPIWIPVPYPGRAFFKIFLEKNIMRSIGSDSSF